MTAPGPAGKPAARGWFVRSAGGAAGLRFAAGLRRLTVAGVVAVGAQKEG